MAGIYQNVDGISLPVYTIITTAANQFVAPIHDRMPVVLWEKTAQRAWMGGDSNLQEIFRNPNKELHFRAAV